MDIDGFIAAGRPTWERLDRLVADARRGRLDADGVDALVRAYERTSTHLSVSQTALRDPALTTELTRRVARARAVIYGAPSGTWRDARRFVTDAFPAAVWAARREIAVATAVFVVPALVLAVWLGTSPVALDVVAPEPLRERYVERDFADYYTADPSIQFASEVTTNNIRVGVLAFAAGILLCAPTVLVLLLNGANLGVAAGMFAAADQLPRFFGLITPHGLLELTAVFVAGGAGLRLGWTLIDPGDRPRAAALAEVGRSTIVIVVGVAVVFVVAGVIEGFVTGAPLPTWVRVGIGVAAEVVFCGYVLLRGPRALADAHSRPAALVSR